MAGTRSVLAAALLLCGMPMLSVEPAYGTQPAVRSVSTAAPATGPLRWEPWCADTLVPPAPAELSADLIRHVETTMPVRGVSETFPLTGDLLGERAVWATVVVPESEITTWVILVFEHRRGRWRAVARHELSYPIPGPVAPVRIEPSNAWMVANGGSGAQRPDVGSAPFRRQFGRRKPIGPAGPALRRTQQGLGRRRRFDVQRAQHSRRVAAETAVASPRRDSTDPTTAVPASAATLREAAAVCVQRRREDGGP